MFKRYFIINSIIVLLVCAGIIIGGIAAGKAFVNKGAEDKLVAAVRQKAAELSKQADETPTVDYEENGVYFSLLTPRGDFVGGKPDKFFDGGETERPSDGVEPAEPADGSQPDKPEGENQGAEGGAGDGQTPPDMPVGERGEYTPINLGITRREVVGGVEYVVYDEFVVINGERYLLRGSVSLDANSVDTMIIVFTIITAITAIVALILNYVSLKRAVKPIHDMALALDKVQKSSDLSERVEINTADPDIRELCTAYNRMLERLESILSSQERFTSDVSHELRSPLTVLLAESEFALNDLKTVEEKDRSLAAIYEQTKRLTVMVRQLLDFSRVVNTETVKLSAVELSSLTKQTAEALTADKNVTLELDVDDNITVQTEETLYIRMLTNLIDNAVKYGKPSGMVKVSLKGGESTTLIVKDDGIGMSEETVAHIFDRMYQYDKSRSNSGLGLGLSFVKEIARILGCDVLVESSLGEGTTFTIVFKE